jgi:hypothetical protein
MDGWSVVGSCCYIVGRELGHPPVVPVTRTYTGSDHSVSTVVLSPVFDIYRVKFWDVIFLQGTSVSPDASSSRQSKLLFKEIIAKRQCEQRTNILGLSEATRLRY